MRIKPFNLHCFITSIIIFLLSDALLVVFPNVSYYHISYILKGCVLLYYLWVAITLLNFKALFYLVVFTLIFAASQTYLFYIEKIDNAGFLDNLQFFTWYFFCIVLMLIYDSTNLFFQGSKAVSVLNRVTFAIIACVCIVILIGFIFDLKQFWSYQGARWGFKGILSKPVTASYFFVLVLSYLYSNFIIHNQKFLFFFLVLLCSLLCGTKTIYFFILLLLFFDIVFKKTYKLKSFWFSVAGLLGFAFIFRISILEKTQFFWGQFYTLYKEKGFMFSFTSHRSEILTDGLNYYNLHWDWLNYFIGGRLTEIKYFEMAFFDMFYFFGILGSLLFIFIAINYVAVPFVKQTGLFGLFIMFSVFLTSFFTGQFFINSTVALLVFYFLVIIRVNYCITEKTDSSIQQ